MPSMVAMLQHNGRELWLDGPHYIHSLAALHGRLSPTTYFEIGTLHGETLKLARCASVAVDPHFQLTVDVEADKPFCRLFEESSDDFFARHDLTDVLGARVDLAFLDGLHQFSFLLRDFINTERHCHSEATIVMHDCLPRDAAMTGGAERTSGAHKYRAYWTGDVWKIVPVLRKYRPELCVTCLDSSPTGLVVCTGLEPASRTLSDAYDEIVAQWVDLSLEAYGLSRLFAEADVQSTQAWLNGMAPFRHPQPRWKRTVKRVLRRP
jgi:hypothetical protein